MLGLGPALRAGRILRIARHDRPKAVAGVVAIPWYDLKATARAVAERSILAAPGAGAHHVHWRMAAAHAAAGRSLGAVPGVGARRRH